MKRRLATALASAALLALSLTAGLEAGAQTSQGPERTGVKRGKPVKQSCPVHPEFKARTAGRCPKCRVKERTLNGAREKERSKGATPQQEEGSASNE